MICIGDNTYINVSSKTIKRAAKIRRVHISYTISAKDDSHKKKDVIRKQSITIFSLNELLRFIYDEEAQAAVLQDFEDYSMFTSYQTTYKIGVFKRNRSADFYTSLSKLKEALAIKQ